MWASGLFSDMGQTSNRRNGGLNASPPSPLFFACTSRDMKSKAPRGRWYWNFEARYEFIQENQWLETDWCQSTRWQNRRDVLVVDLLVLIRRRRDVLSGIID
jgi:hypothetical protein